ncbi:IDEAL domain-containing protein [Priestia sp. FSL W8-0001]|uniref:IDEAL domain-containing protein n=1 Tax=unclassified Priestia TaxID=2800374 RepID=UPI0030FC5E98
MNNEKSYAEMMKSLARKRKVREADNVLDMYIDMIIDDALFKHKKSILETQINYALDERDRTAFYDLSLQYQSLLKTST